MAALCMNVSWMVSIEQHSVTLFCLCSSIMFSNGYCCSGLPLRYFIFLPVNYTTFLPGTEHLPQQMWAVPGTAHGTNNICFMFKYRTFVHSPYFNHSREQNSNVSKDLLCSIFIWMWISVKMYFCWVDPLLILGVLILIKANFSFVWR